MRNARLSLWCTLWLSACATAPVAQVPAPPRVEAKTAPTLSLSIASGATKLSLPCAPTENPVNNGIDDDCDGRVDQLDVAKSALHVALVHASDVDVQLSISAEAPAKAPAPQAATEHLCDGSTGFALHHVDVARLEPGSYDLKLARAGACGAEKDATVSASVWVLGKAEGLYTFRLEPGESATIGRLDVK